MYLPEYSDKEDFHIFPDGSIVETHEHGYERHELTSYRDDSWVLMLYTGVQDKNGKDIYQGDIVRCSYGFGKVVFAMGCFIVEWIDDKQAMVELLTVDNDFISRKKYDMFEVIGNTYENSELLNSNPNLNGTIATEGK